MSKKKPLDILLSKKLITLEIKQVLTGNKKKDHLILQIKPYLIQIYFEDLKNFFQSYSLTLLSFHLPRQCHICKNKFYTLIQFTSKRKLYCTSCGIAFLHFLTKKDIFTQQTIAILDFLLIHGLILLNQISQNNICLKKAPITPKGGKKV